MDQMVTFTMKQLLITASTVVCTIVGGIWLILTFMIGGLQSDNASIKQDLVHLRAASTDVTSKSRDGESKLADQIAGLRTEIAAFGGKLDGVNTVIATLNTRLNDMQRQFAQRQTSLQNPQNLAKFGDLLKAQLNMAGDAKVLVVPFDSAIFPPQ